MTPTSSMIADGKNNLQWYTQQLQRFIFANLSETCCEAKRWKTQFPSVKWPQILLNLTSTPKPPRPSPEPSPNLAWLCAKVSSNLLRNLFRNPVEPDLAVHQSLPDLLRNLLRNPVLTWLCTEASIRFAGTFRTFSGTSLNVTRRLRQCTPELFWAEDPMSLRCWGKRDSQFQIFNGLFKAPAKNLTSLNVPADPSTLDAPAPTWPTHRNLK